MEDKKITCTICKRETEWDGNPFRPFCSERCRLRDLGCWASGEYRIAGEKKGLSESDEEDGK